MEIMALDRTVQSAPVTAQAIPVDKAAENRDAVQAVKALNGAQMFGQDNELMFQRDRSTNRMVIRLVDRKTDEVVSQIPPEYVLRLAEDMKQNGD